MVASHSLNILCVEDELGDLGLLQEFFVQYKIGNLRHFASSAEMALTMVEQLDYDLLLVDVGLPQMDGIEFAKCCRKILPNAVICCLTSVVDQATEKRALDAGIFYFISKPLDFELLLRMMDKIDQSYIDIRRFDAEPKYKYI